MRQAEYIFLSVLAGYDRILFPFPVFLVLPLQDALNLGFFSSTIFEIVVKQLSKEGKSTTTQRLELPYR